MTILPSRWRRATLLPLLLAGLAGCVERQIVITTDPPYAIVYDERNLPLSGTPADKSFTYYGKYHFTLVKGGYETLDVVENVDPPWYEIFLLDFVSENVVPWTIRDIRRFHYKLQPAIVIPPGQVLEQGRPLRARGLTIGEPLPPPYARPGTGVDGPRGAVTNPGTPPIAPTRPTPADSSTSGSGP